jgi:Nucleotidyltransferase/DNA polymerase involved in DNA repair
MNSFFVSCELVRHPEYKKLPLVIAANDKRSVVTAASYAAKELGIDSAMPLQTALRRCSDLTIVPPDFEYYRACSKKIMNFLKQFSKEIRVSSIDEAYLDVSHYFENTEISNERVLKLAKYIQTSLLKELGFPCNIGISTTKFLAKMASELRKPFAIETLYLSEIEEKLWPLAIGKMYGIGRKTSEILRYLNIKTIGDFANFENENLLERLLGKHILEQLSYAQGRFIDEKASEIKMREERKSISQSRTFRENVTDMKELIQMLEKLWQNIVNEVKEKQVKFRSIKVFYKQGDFHTMQRSFTFTDFTNDFPEAYKKATELFTSLWDGAEIRLVGIGVADFISQAAHAEQLSIFSLDTEQTVEMIKREKIKAALSLNKEYNLVTATELK